MAADTGILRPNTHWAWVQVEAGSVVALARMEDMWAWIQGVAASGGVGRGGTVMERGDG